MMTLKGGLVTKVSLIALTLAGSAFVAATASAQPAECRGLPDYATLKKALDAATSEEKSGLNNQMWATIVGRDGTVCAVVFSGKDRGAQWLGSRVISAQKANTANLFSLDNSSNSNGSGHAERLAPLTGEH